MTAPLSCKLIMDGCLCTVFSTFSQIMYNLRLACDGLWDVMSDQGMCKPVQAINCSVIMCRYSQNSRVLHYSLEQMQSTLCSNTSMRKKELDSIW
jgi:serine/threonine protein phosphatase PrpC